MTVKANRELSVLSYNIHKGFSLGNWRFCLAEIRELLRQSAVDLVFLQEVIGENELHAKSTPDWPGTTQYEFLADEVWQSYSYGKNAVYQSGHHGNAILSRLPISHFDNYNISTNRLEQRGALRAEIPLLETAIKLHVCCTHLDLRKRGQMQQVKKIATWISEVVPADAPLILAGDFNDRSDHASPTLRSALGIADVIYSTKGRLEATFPAVFPIWSLDRLYVRGAEILEAKVLRDKVWKRLSDHLPVYARLRF